MGKRIPWSKEEELLLSEYYTEKSKEELLIMFKGRTWKAIRSKAHTLSLKRTNDYEKIKDEDLYKTINGIKYKLCKKCRRYLPLDFLHYPEDRNCNDSFRNICKKCRGVNFGRSTAKEWDNKSVNLLLKYYSTMTNKDLVNTFFPTTTVKSIRDKAYSLGLKKDRKTLSMIRQNMHTEESRLKISKARKLEGKFVGENNPMFNSCRIGSLNPNWKGGKTSTMDKLRNSAEYNEWRRLVFERDNYTCQCCNRKTHNNEAHHLNNFADFEDLRFNVNNGITLCTECHNPNRVGSFHYENGTLNNTQEQFYEWLAKKKKTLK